MDAPSAPSAPSDPEVPDDPPLPAEPALPEDPSSLEPPKVMWANPLFSSENTTFIVFAETYCKVSGINNL